MNKELLLKISKHFQERDSIPLFGKGPSIDIETLSQKLAKQFGVEEVSIQIKSQKWDEETNRNVDRIIFPIQISPIDQPVYWMMTRPDRDKLLSQMMYHKDNKTPFSSTALQDGFYQFILLEALSSIQELEPFEQMTFQLNESEKIPDEDGIAVGVEISFGSFSSWGTLLISNTFRKTWVQHYAAFPPQYVVNNLSRKLPLEIGLKVGRVDLPVKDLKKLKAGDLVIPDRYNTENRGTFFLGETALFDAQMLKNGQIKLTQYAFNTEETMDDQITNDAQEPASLHETMQEAPIEQETPPEEKLSQQLETADHKAKDIKELPIQVSVEIARLKLTLDELMNLSPGNLLDIPPLADKRLSLVANGQKIGAAELVEIGDTLGLKIIEI